MSAGALATVIGYATMFGTVRQADDGAAAHIWQILMVGQVPADVLPSMAAGRPKTGASGDDTTNRRGPSRHVSRLVVPLVIKAALEHILAAGTNETPVAPSLSALVPDPHPHRPTLSLDPPKVIPETVVDDFG